MPGLSSVASKVVQSGAIEFVTTDAAGNLASDSGATAAAIAASQTTANGAQTTANNAQALATQARNTANTAAANVSTVATGSASALGGGAAYNPATGAWTGPTYAVGGQTFNNVGEAMGAVSDTLISMQSDIGAIRDGIGRANKRIDQNSEGVAMALAMSGLGGLEKGETIAMSIDLGNFEGKNAMAMAGAVRLSDNLAFSAGVGVGVDQGTVGTRAGLRLGW